MIPEDEAFDGTWPFKPNFNEAAGFKQHDVDEKAIHKSHGFPPSIIQHAVWLYYRFNLSIRDMEDLLAERNISVSYEAIRLWINKFGPEFTQRLRRDTPASAILTFWTRFS